MLSKDGGKSIFLGITLLVILIDFAAETAGQALPPALGDVNRKQNAMKLPPCRLCTVLVESFQKGIERTARNKHDGGDAAWEEERLGSYKTSELRLVEIQEKLCEDVSRGQDQCHSLAEEQESNIEEWWLRHQTSSPDLYKWLCVQEAKLCCPWNHFGPDCLECEDCHGNGKCKGNGTRKGNGRCACDSGYMGDGCMQCVADTHYESYRDATMLLCSQCHVACGAGGCTGAGPQACRVCRDGWKMIPEQGGCVDMDECLQSAAPPCKRNQFCVNNEGSFSCLECDRSCDGCTGDGPDLCNACADGYELHEGLCRDMSRQKRDQFVNITRYLTYVGLCVATCVILQSSVWLASAVGLAVALYISVSEYWLSQMPEDDGGVEEALKNIALDELIGG